MDVLHETIDHLWAEEVALGDSVSCETSLFVPAVLDKLNPSKPRGGGLLVPQRD